MKTSKNKLKKRQTVSLILLFTLIIVSISALIVHLTHDKEALSHSWLHVHAYFGILFVIVSIYHTIYNWQVMKKYLTNR